MLTLFKAQRIVNRALQRAKELNISISVAVCDQNGRLIALNQMDESMDWAVDRYSMGKRSLQASPDARAIGYSSTSE